MCVTSVTISALCNTAPQTISYMINIKTEMKAEKPLLRS